MSKLESNSIKIRDELPGDVPCIRSIVYDAFLNHPHHAPGALPTEHKIVDELRECGRLTLSVVALVDDSIVGHVAYSPVSIEGKPTNWLGLGPVAVRPSWQRRAIGKQLITTTLTRLRTVHVGGIVVLGEPEYYSRFGFTAHSKLILEGVPPEYFMALCFSGSVPSGVVTYHPAFNVA